MNFCQLVSLSLNYALCLCSGIKTIAIAFALNWVYEDLEIYLLKDFWNYFGSAIISMFSFCIFSDSVKIMEYV